MFAVKSSSRTDYRVKLETFPYNDPVYCCCSRHSLNQLFWQLFKGFVDLNAIWNFFPKLIYSFVPVLVLLFKNYIPNGIWQDTPIALIVNYFFDMTMYELFITTNVDIQQPTIHQSMFSSDCVLFQNVENCTEFEFALTKECMHSKRH